MKVVSVIKDILNEYFQKDIDFLVLLRIGILTKIHGPKNREISIFHAYVKLTKILSKIN